ncbi:AAA domain-containing protein [Mycoplasmopsis cynos]|uniref:AAA domain-containing protein n=1 Tax=Mycoplasmopsis cynos TaxID=171284 RepID=UPI002FEE8A82
MFWCVVSITKLPPGTGKTQVISALIDYYQSKHQNIMLTSSTHEAIDNVFDRFAKLRPVNPNIFAIKISSGNRATDDNPYSKENLSSRYIDALVSEENLLQRINKTSNKLLEFCMDINKNINEQNKKLWKISIRKILDGKNIEHIKEYISDFCSDPEGDISLDDEHSKKIISILNKYDYLKFGKELKKQGINSLEKIENYIKNESDKKKENLWNYEVINKIKNELNIALDENNSDDLNENSFWDVKLVDVLFDNELVNLFGLTTTASSEIEHNGKFIDLTNDYKIDLTIMDETSKSNLFEIINRCLHSGKSILCGDSYQLPPTVNFSEELYNWVIEEKLGLDNISKKEENEMIADINESLNYILILMKK